MDVFLLQFSDNGVICFKDSEDFAEAGSFGSWKKQHNITDQNRCFLVNGCGWELHVNMQILVVQVDSSLFSGLSMRPDATESLGIFLTIFDRKYQLHRKMRSH